jgi:hypothetical protein
MILISIPYSILVLRGEGTTLTNFCFTALVNIVLTHDPQALVLQVHTLQQGLHPCPVNFCELSVLSDRLLDLLVYDHILVLRCFPCGVCITFFE